MNPYYSPVSDDLMSIPAMARELKIRATRLRTAIEIGDLPGPKNLEGARMYYLIEDIKTLKPLVKKLDLQKEVRNKRPLPKGYYARRTIATLAGIAAIAVTWHIETGRIPRPTHKLINCRYPLYNEKEKDQILKILRERKGWNNKARRGRRPIAA